MRNAPVVIDPRFRGPPRSANGGYAAGLLGRQFAGPARVRLLRPPPLATPLILVESGEGLQLRHDDRLIAVAAACELALEPPPALTVDAARTAGQGYLGFASHPFPGCFVCGPARAEGDGLRIFPGRRSDARGVAAAWTPAPELADAAGEVRPEFVWAALDCTGFFAFAPLPEGRPALLGELSVHRLGPLRAGVPHVVSGWLLEEDGRKRRVGSALHDADGALVAIALGTWIVLREEAVSAHS